MTPARAWPRGFGGPSYPALIEADDDMTAGRLRMTSGAGVDGLLFDWASRGVRVDCLGRALWVRIVGKWHRRGRIRTLGFGVVKCLLESPPPWPDRSPDWRPDGMIAEDFHA